MVQKKTQDNETADETAAVETVEAAFTTERETPVRLTDDQMQKVSSLEVPRVDDDKLRELSSYAQALELAAELYEGRIIDLSEELGTGFEVLNDTNKDRLIDKGFLIIAFRFNNSAEFGGLFASAIVMSEAGEKFILNDGSSGIRDQLMDMAQRSRQFGGYEVKKGLRKSEYPTCPPGQGGCGRPRTVDETECSTPNCSYIGDSRGRGQTYYLNL